MVSGTIGWGFETLSPCQILAVRFFPVVESSMATHQLPLSEEEVDLLQSMLSVIVRGGGRYQMLSLPSIVHMHEDVLFKLEKIQERIRAAREF